MGSYLRFCVRHGGLCPFSGQYQAYEYESERRHVGLKHNRYLASYQVRPRSRVFGQVSLGRREQLELNRYGPSAPRAWTTSDLTERLGVRQLQLIVRASIDRHPDWYLQTLPDTLIGLPRDVSDLAVLEAVAGNDVSYALFWVAEGRNRYGHAGHERRQLCVARFQMRNSSIICQEVS
jgi:hypothetical protein